MPRYLCEEKIIEHLIHFQLELRRLIKEGNSANRQKIIGHLPLALRKGAAGHIPLRKGEGGHGKDYDSGSLTKGGWDPKGKK